MKNTISLKALKFMYATIPSLLIMVIFLAESSQAEEKSTNEYQLETITVTAQKKEENVQNVPISMNVFSGIQIEDAGITDIADLTQFSPNLFPTPNIENRSVVIRGISNHSAALNPSAGIFVNDIPYSLNRMQNPDLMDIERIEVLRGPQGSLYGKNTESGVINIITRQPGNDCEGKVFGDISVFDTANDYIPMYRVGGSVSGPVKTDTFFVGVSFQSKNSDGYLENIYNGDEKTAEIDHKMGQITFRWKPTTFWDISFINDVSKNDDGYGSMRYLTGDGKSDRFETNWNGDNYWATDNNSQVIRAKYSGQNFDILSITSRSDFKTEINYDTDYGPFDYQNNNMIFDILSYNQEIRISSPKGPQTFNWVFGLFGSRDETYAKRDTPSRSVLRNTDMTCESLAVFGQGTYTLYDRLHLTAGARYEHQELEGEQFNKFAEVQNYSSSNSNDEFLPKLSAAFDINKDIMAYLTFAKGFLSGGYDFFMGNNADDLYFKPEHTTCYEAGLKTAFFDNRLIINAAVFYIDIEDKQVLEWPLGAGVKEVDITNAAEASSKGFELELKARPLTGLDLFAGFGYTEAKFDEWITTLSTEATFDYKDNYLPTAPKYTFHAGAQYRAKNGLYTRCDLIGTSEYYYNAENTQEDKVDGYETVNLKIGYEQEKYDIVLWADNLFDEKYFISSMKYLGTMVQDGAPRTMGIKLTYRF